MTVVQNNFVLQQQPFFFPSNAVDAYLVIHLLQGHVPELMKSFELEEVLTLIHDCDMTAILW